MGYIPYNYMAKKDLQLELEELERHLKSNGIMGNLEVFIDKSYGKHNLKYGFKDFGGGESDLSLNNTKKELCKQLRVVNNIFEMLHTYTKEDEDDVYERHKSLEVE